MAIKSSDQITIVDITDAYSVILTSEAYTFVGGTSGVASGATCSTQAVALCGNATCDKVSVDQSKITCPTGISAAVTNNNTSAVTITFTTTATISASCEATIPVSVDGITVNKKFSFAVAKTGQTGASGVSVTGVTTYYLTTSASSGVTTSTSGWATTPTATTTTNKYIWSYQKITYSSGNPTNSTPAIIGTHGATGGTGATGKGISGVKSMYLTTSSGSSVTTSTTGWKESPTATTTTNKYMWMYQIITYTDSTTSTTTPAIISTHGATGAKGDKGDTGDPGADAISISITTSSGNVFKNSEGTTILTAHVFKGGVELSSTEIAAIGTLKWYKTDDDETNVAVGNPGVAELPVSAADITNKAAYTVQLEA